MVILISPWSNPSISSRWYSKQFFFWKRGFSNKRSWKNFGEGFYWKFWDIANFEVRPGIWLIWKPVKSRWWVYMQKFLPISQNFCNVKSFCSILIGQKSYPKILFDIPPPQFCTGFISNLFTFGLIFLFDKFGSSSLEIMRVRINDSQTVVG